MSAAEDPLDVAERLLAASDGGRHRQLLAEAHRLLLTAGPAETAGPRRSRLVYDVAERLLAVAVAGPRPEALDAALHLVDTEIARIIGQHDTASAVLLVAIRGALRDERFYLGHALDDLTGAINDLAMVTRTLTGAPELLATHDQAWCFHVFGRALLRLADHQADIGRVAEAVAALEQALALAGEASWNLRAAITQSLVTARVTLEERRLTGTGSTDELDAALDAAVTDLTALASSEDGADSDRAGWWQNTAVLLGKRVRRAGRDPAGRAADLAAGLRAADDGLALLPRDDPGRISLLAVRADLIRAGDGTPAAVEEALRAEFAAAVDLNHPEAVIAGANLATQYAAGHRWAAVADVGTRCHRVVDTLIRRQPRDGYRWAIVRQAAGLAAVTAHALACDGRAGAAVLALERGQVTELSDRYARPRQVYRLLSNLGQDALAADYRAAISAVRDAEQPDHVLRRAEARLAEITTRIATVPGTAALSREVDSSAVLAAASGHPVVYLASGRYGGVAVCVNSDGSYALQVIDDLTVARVQPVAVRFARQVIAAGTSPRTRSRAINATCAWLGRFVLPHVDRLVGTGVDEVTVVPTGHLAGLPLHAALVTGPHGPRWASVRRRYTFTPSVMLLHGPGAALDSGASALIVADPARRDQDSLRAAHPEAATVRSTFPGARVLAGADATAGAVTTAMPGSRILHFACHGVAVADDPMRSALLLAGDDELQLAQLAATPMDGVDLAVLAACRTAASDIALPGESLNLAAGLLAAGTRTVIGSLWPVPDAPTAALMAVFYARLAAGRPPADALREAQVAFADGTVPTPPEAGGDEWRDPYFWAGFVCLGR